MHNARGSKTQEYIDKLKDYPVMKGQFLLIIKYSLGDLTIISKLPWE